MRDVARLVTLVERDDPGAPAERAAALAAIEDRPLAPVVGFTGAPGVGKSTLLGALASVLAEPGDRRIAIVAVDPSSAVSGGALLGDRTRIRVPSGRVFVRSQASQVMPGGLAPRPTRWCARCGGCSTWCCSRRSASGSRRTTSGTSPTRRTCCCSRSPATPCST